MYIGVRRSSLGHFNGSDAQGPDVSQAVVAHLLDDLRGHPEGSADHRVTLGHGVLRGTGGGGGGGWRGEDEHM